MTTQEAISILSKDTSIEAINKLIYYEGFSRDKVIEYIQEAMTMGAKALEKQDAKKPIKVFHEDVKVNWNSCPTCKQGIGWGKKRDVNNCWNCGQKLDWGD